MLEAGDDPLFVLRRMLIFASEDVGNADPRALVVAVAADARVPPHGHARGHLPARAGVRSTSRARRSRTRATIAWQRAKELDRRARRAARADEAAQRGDAADEARRATARATSTRTTSRAASSPGETYLPDELAGDGLYEPTERGEEARIRARLAALRAAARAKDEG